MVLAAGTRLDGYEILGSLGKGGMGEVYRALDTKLGREVAIKTLPVALAKDADRLARFEREAKLLATLSHAHIGAIYGLDEHDGTLYIAMELVEGETLEEKLKAGPLPVEDALRLALQIAEALEAAHDKGVVHRDLKPANIMVTRDGVAKVLDFGLAKAFSGDPNEASPAHSPALSVAMTQQGLILGTAAYMSPEQASGQATDQRADVWAFGVVLYEMLTGLPLFGGESVPHILADVLRTEPDWSRLPKNLHPRLKLLLERCLEKKIRNRYHSIADVRVDIEKILSDPKGVAPQSERGVRAGRASARWWPYAAVLVAAAAGVAAILAWRSPPAPAPRVQRFALEAPAGELLGVDSQSRSITISADGSQIVFATAPPGTENYQWYVRAIDSLTATRLRGAEARFETPFFSPDGRWIGFNDLSKGNVLKRIPVLGGPPITIATTGNPVRGASWGQNDAILYGTDREGLWRVPASGGDPERLTHPEGAVSHRWPEWLPGGRAALFTIADGETEQIALLDIATGETRVLISDGTTPKYVATGHIVYGAADGSLRAAPFDLATLTVTGDPVPVLEEIAMSSYTGGAHYALSDEGSLIYVTGGRNDDGGGVKTSLTWVDTQGREEPLGLAACSCRYFRISPDGTRVVVEVKESAADVSRSLWIWSLAQRTFTRLTFSPPTESPAWSPDSKQVAYAGIEGGVPTLYARRSAAVAARRDRQESERLAGGRSTDFRGRQGRQCLLARRRAQDDGASVEPRLGPRRAAAIVAGRPLAGLHLRGIRTATGLRPAVPRRR
jgi:hypothetical protein